MSAPRRLRDGEVERWLELLAGWPFQAGSSESRWAAPHGSGADFFRRYAEHDPSFAPENVWVVEAERRLVSCVQIFPRRLRVEGSLDAVENTVACGGIGSVFTRPEERGRGHAGALLRAAVDDMTERRMDVSLLVAARVGWYESLGWHSWSDRRARLRPREARGGGESVRRFEPGDLEAVRRLGERYTAGRVGSVLRSAADWEASLRLGGNPGEDFWLAFHGERLVAYLRAADLYGERQFLEWGHEPGLAEAQVALFEHGAATAGSVVTMPLCDPVLRETLEERGWRIEEEPGSSWMLRVLDPARLAGRVGCCASAEPRSLLSGLLPPERFAFWMADRF